MGDGLRIDKFVWFVRLAKTRSVASDLVQKGKIKLNGLQVKSSREVKIGDYIQIVRHTAIFEFKILNVLDKRIGSKFVCEYILDVTQSEEIEKLKVYQAAQSGYRQYGTGKPTKHDRQNIEDFLDTF